MSELKILISGTGGAGKTTAIRGVSEIAPQSADARLTGAPVDKARAAANVNYGELTLDDGQKLYLYGMPDPGHFGPLWRTLSRDALGTIVLVDNSRPEPLADLDNHIAALSPLLHSTPCVIAVTRMDQHGQPDLETYALHLQLQGLLCPVVPADVRRPAQVVALIELLLLQIEALSPQPPAGK